MPTTMRSESDSARPIGRNHVLLIGIDDYMNAAPLAGCVNDIASVRELLLTRFGVSDSEITVLAAPRADGMRLEGAAVPTLQAIREALVALGSDAVSSDDRIIVYFSGHGASRTVTGAGPSHLVECIVPVDFKLDEKPEKLLYDVELNRRIAAIERRTPHVTLIFDCCHSAGVTRAVFATGYVARRIELPSIDVSDVSSESATSTRQVLQSGTSRGVSTRRARALTLAACLADEVALEGVGPDGLRHGVFTRALLGALDVSDPRLLTWREIWAMLIADTRPRQTPVFYGDDRHSIFGESTAGDRGEMPVTPDDDTYAVSAGTLTDVVCGAIIGVYGSTPARLPRIGSAEDRIARIGSLVVTEATKRAAVARAKEPFEWPTGARCRLVSTPAPLLSLSIEGNLAASALDDLQHNTSIVLVAPHVADLRLIEDKGSWVFCDDVHGLARQQRPELVRAETQELPFYLAGYLRYRAPLRVASRCTDLPGALSIKLLDAKTIPDAIDLQSPNLPEVSGGDGFRYILAAGAPFCIRVENTSDQPLRSVTLLNCGTSGRVQRIASLVLPPNGMHVLWSDEELGEPFTLQSPPSGAAAERLVLLGSTDPGVDWSYLETDDGFAHGDKSGASPKRPGLYTATTLAVLVR
jgi:Caspase domain